MKDSCYGCKAPKSCSICIYRNKCQLNENALIGFDGLLNRLESNEDLYKAIIHIEQCVAHVCPKYRLDPVIREIMEKE